jgi:DNA repair exonuclease SbcCD ATPase subunit
MRLLRVRVDDFRGIDHFEVAFATEGVTVIEAPNETGKSSLLDAVDLLLNEKDSSKKRVVRDAKPVGRDVGSRVEVELTCGDLHLTCVKQFNKQPMTELTVHAPRREQLTGTEAHDRLRAILESEVDLALFEALRFQQGRGLDGVALGSSNVIAARLDEVAGGSGDAGDDDLLARVREEFETYFTPKGQEGKRLKEVDAAAERAHQRRDAIAGRLADLEDDIAELGRLQREHARLIDERERLTPQLEAHRERRQRVLQLRQRLAEAATEVERARRRHDDAVRAADARRETVEEIGEAQRELEELTGRLAPAEQRVEELTARLEEVSTGLAEAERERDRTERAAAQAELRTELLGLEDEHARLVRTQERVEEVRGEARSAAAFIDGCRLSDALLSEIRAAAEQTRVAERTLEAGAPGVTLHARRDLEVEIDGRTEQVSATASRTWQVGDRLHLEVPGVVGLQVRAGTSLEELRVAVEEARRRHDAACHQAGVEDLAQAETVADRLREHQGTLRRCDEELDRALEGLGRDELSDRVGSLESRIQHLTAQLGEVTVPMDLARAREELGDARAGHRAAVAEVERARAEWDAFRSEVEQRRHSLLTDQTRREHLVAEVERLQGRLEAARSQRDDRTVTEEATEAGKLLGEAEATTVGLDAELAELDPEQVELLATNAERTATDLEERLVETGQARSARQARLDVVGEEGLGEQLAVAEIELAHAEREQRRVRTRAAAAEALYAELRSARDEAYRAYQQPLRDLIARQGRVVFGEGLEVELDEELKVTRRTLDGDTLDWEALSSGAKEQLAILSALAAARLAADGGVPLVLDDALGYTDPDRLAALGAVLGTAEGSQVIVLTCVGERYRHVGGAKTVRLVPGEATRS